MEVARTLASPSKNGKDKQKEKQSYKRVMNEPSCPYHLFHLLQADCPLDLTFDYPGKLCQKFSTLLSNGLDSSSPFFVQNLSSASSLLGLMREELKDEMMMRRQVYGRRVCR